MAFAGLNCGEDAIDVRGDDGQPGLGGATTEFVGEAGEDDKGKEEKDGVGEFFDREAVAGESLADLGAGVAAEVVEGDVVGTPEKAEGGDGEDEHATGTEDAEALPETGLVVGEMLEDIEGDDGIEACIGEGEGHGIALDEAGESTGAAVVERFFAHVEAGDGVGGIEGLGDGTGSAAEIEDFGLILGRELLIEKGERGATAPDEPPVVILEVTHLVVFGVVHGAGSSGFGLRRRSLPASLSLTRSESIRRPSRTTLTLLPSRCCQRIGTSAMGKPRSRAIMRDSKS